MSGGSPQLKSPLISATDSQQASDSTDRSGTPDGITVIPNRATAELRKEQQQLMRKTPTWKLKYQDFIPLISRRIHYHGSEDNSQSFQSLLDRANDWLQKNPDVKLKSCETITWVDSDTRRFGDSENVVLTKPASEKAKAHYMRGLRLWLKPRSSRESDSGSRRPQTLCYSDIAPEGADNIHSLINKANKKIDKKLLTGKLLSIETVSVPVVNGNMSTKDTKWTEHVKDDLPYAYILRIFQVKSDDNKYTIGIKDFVPLPNEDGYEGFGDLTDKANMWVKDQADIIVKNMQSLMVQKDDGPHSEMGTSCFFTNIGVNRETPTELFRVLRVAFMRPRGDLVADLPVCYPFTFVTFIPEIIRPRNGHGKERMEKYRETFARVTQYLKGTGAEIISCETVMNPMQMTPSDAAQPIIPSEETNWLLTLRVYLTDTGEPPDSQVQQDVHMRVVRAPRTSSFRQASKRSKDKEVRPGPIFLGHVVTRQYRYRWMVAAVTVFVCMTLIVVISVVYSNK